MNCLKGPSIKDVAQRGEGVAQNVTAALIGLREWDSDRGVQKCEHFADDINGHSLIKNRAPKQSHLLK